VVVTSTERDEALRRVVAAAADSDRTGVVFRAAGGGTEGMRTDVRIRGHELTVDEPAGLAGGNAAPSPVETALAALLSCQVVTYRVWAARLGIPLDAVEAEVEGDLDVRGFYGLDDTVRPGFGAVRVRVRLRGPASDDDYRALQAAVDEHCPVLDVFRGATPVRTELVTAGQDGAHE
jgi:uncharacterized OsmC-like protein